MLAYESSGFTNIVYVVPLGRNLMCLGRGLLLFHGIDGKLLKILTSWV